MSENAELLTCREMVRLITAYVEDVLPLPERLRFEQHLSICDGCTAYIDQMRELIRHSAGLSEEQLVEPLRQEFLRVFADWKEGGNSL